MPRSSSTAIDAATDCGRTRSAAASSLADRGPWRSSLLNSEICDAVSSRRS